MKTKLLSQNLSRIWASLIINELYQNQITQFYISPGMRNAPLIAALDHLKQFYPEIQMIICVDERAAAYRALGYSKATGKPSVLICTSGTAMANYYPAVIEAYKSNLPLIIISADRPPELSYCDDNQTIDQIKFFGKYVRGEMSLSPELEISPLALTTTISNLIHKSLFPQMGPVHLNAPFREPLENTSTSIPASYIELANFQMNRMLPSTAYAELETHLSKKGLMDLAKRLNSSEKGILVIGSLTPVEDLKIIKNFVQKLSWPTYFDISSSLKYEFNLQNNTLPTFDHPEVQEELVKNPPHTILHIGGRLTSKHYYSILKKLPDINLITLNKSIDKEDPSHHTKLRINADIGPTLHGLYDLIAPQFNQQKYSERFYKFSEEKRKIIDAGPLSFPLVSKTIIDLIPDDRILYLGNSTAVRSFDSYISQDINKHITVATNRGVSGIEGFIASSCGLADGTHREVNLVFGDISFIHDLNSLYFLKTLNTPIKMIVINNFSGGIFTLLPINKETDVIKYIASPHQNTFENAAKLAEIEYLAVTNKNDLKNKLMETFNKTHHCLLEIFVNNDENISVYELLRTIKLD